MAKLNAEIARVRIKELIDTKCGGSHVHAVNTGHKKRPRKEYPSGVVLLLFIEPSLKCLAGLFAKNTIKLQSCVKL